MDICIGDELSLEIPESDWDPISRHFFVPNQWLSLNFEAEGFVVSSIVIGIEERPSVRLRVRSVERIN
jgi:hypothetical protein